MGPGQGAGTAAHFGEEAADLASTSLSSGIVSGQQINGEVEAAYTNPEEDDIK